MKQLDLFDLVPEKAMLNSTDAGALQSGADIIRFPLHRYTGKARRVAEVLSARQGKAQDSYWKRICIDLAGMLRKYGADEAEVERQLRGFRDTVASYLPQGRPRSGGGDAA